MGSNFFFSSDDPEKNFYYILVNALMANFEFQSFWAKKLDFFVMERPFYPGQKNYLAKTISILPELSSPERFWI